VDVAAAAVGAARAAVRVLDRTYKATGELDAGDGATEDIYQRSPRGMGAAAEDDGSGSDEEDEEEGEEGGDEEGGEEVEEVEEEVVHTEGGGGGEVPGRTALCGCTPN
jgi:hypothetical protein